MICLSSDTCIQIKLGLRSVDGLLNILIPRVQDRRGLGFTDILHYWQNDEKT